MIQILIAGDFCQRYRVDEVIKQKKYNILFSDVKPIIEQADYAILNFEFPIVIESKRANLISKCGPNLQGTIDAINAIRYAGFSCCTLANNHILDQGEQCCLDTKNELEKAGIDTVGAGKNIEDARTIKYKKIKDETIAILNCCEHEFSVATEITAGANPLNPIQQYYEIQKAHENADYVLVIVHGGHEHFQLPSFRMKELYRFFIDAGADAVVNHHQHCFSGYEVYKGKPIFYGLGNFCFDNPNYCRTFWNQGFMVKLKLQKDNVSFETIPYNQCNDKPTVNIILEENASKFYDELEQLNIIISDENKLKNAVTNYYINSSYYEMDILEPYSGKIMSKLLDLKLVPRFVRKKKIATILNHIYCESHRDKLIFALASKNK